MTAADRNTTADADDDAEPCHLVPLYKLADAPPPAPTEPPSIAARHQAHYRYCECVGDSSECCVASCPCHDEPPPAPTTCPTCGSDMPSVRRVVEWAPIESGLHDLYCPDSWHQAATS